MKKIIALALACSMTFGLVACGGGSSSKETTAKGGESTASADSLAVCLASEPDTIDPSREIEDRRAWKFWIGTN